MSGTIVPSECRVQPIPIDMFRMAANGLPSVVPWSMVEGDLLDPRGVAMAVTHWAHVYRMRLVARLVPMLDPDDARQLVRETWTGDHHHGWSMPQPHLIGLFRDVGFDSTGPKAGSAVTLYRGSQRPFARGMSWTSSKQIAEKFARQSGGQVFRAVVAPDRILAVLDERDEQEHVVDPRGMRINPGGAPPWPESHFERVRAEAEALDAECRRLVGVTP